MIVRDFLKNINIFKVLDDSQLAAIEDSFFGKEYVQGDKIFAEGEPASHIWIVVEGRVDLRFDLPGRTTSDETTISTVRDSDVFGWSSLVPPHKYKLSAYCATKHAKIMRCNRDTLTKLFEDNKKVGYLFMSGLIKVVGKRFQQLQTIASPMPIAKIKATVHMGTCGITAGAREVMTALLDEKSKTDRNDITIESAGCIGKCLEEPNVTVEINGRESVIYRKVNAEKAKQIFTDHLIEGKVLTDYTLPNE
jgi:CRP-like cAMP-binding protein